MTEQKSKKSSSGFTLIEILIAVAILALAVSLVLPNFNFFQRQSSLDMTAQEIIGALRLAQNKTLASEGADSFGLYFETDKFTLFKGLTFYPTSPENDTHKLPPALRLSEVNLSGGGVIVFDRLTGATANSGSLKISLVDDSSKNKIIFIDSSGTVALSSSLPTDEERKKDSRHTEITYGQDAQNIAALTLYFPTADQTESVNYQTYLNDDKSVFSWEKTITVQGREQTIKIHTHSLALANAIFCVHRDRRYNSQALNIFLDGQNLVNYSSTGTTTRGTSLWAGEPATQ